MNNTQDSHQVAEQNTAYRRGVVLGLTMAEIAILVIFVLLLMLGLVKLRLHAAQEKLEGEVLIAPDSLAKLQKADSTLAALQEVLHLPRDATVDEIQLLVRAVSERTSTAEGLTALEEAQRAATEMQRVREAIARDGGSADLAVEAERQAFKIANQEGQLRNYERRLAQAGLGTGERPCWVRTDGTIDYLYDIILTSAGIRMRECTPYVRERERALLDMPSVDPAEVLTPGEFLRRTQGLYEKSQADSCRFFVVVYDGTGPTEKELYKMLLRTVEGHFYKRLDRGPVPF